MSLEPAAPPGADSFCAVTDGAPTADLAWLAHQGAAALSRAFDDLASEHGLADLRDWMVLTLAGDGSRRTQLEIATQLAIDKSTMVVILDRLERDGLIVRTSSPRDRRVRIPEATAAGDRVQAIVSEARAARADAVLDGVSAADRAVFRTVLWRLAQRPG